jgi:SpoIID/LytB domain protein
LIRGAAAAFFGFSLFLTVMLPAGPALPQLQKANALWWKGDYGGAEASYLDLAASGSRELETRLELAAHYRSRAEYGPAMEQYTILLGKFKSGDLGADLAMVPLGECLYYTGRLDEAERVFRRALESSPGTLSALFGLGRTLYEKGNLPGADIYLSLAVLLFPRFSGSSIYLARIAEREGDLQKAIEIYQRALKIDGHQVELRYELGELYQRLERFEESFREYHRLTSMDADNPYLIARLEEVRPRLARAEEEIIPVKTLEKFASLKYVARPLKIPLLRVGLNTDQRGDIVPLESVTFLADGEFRIVPAVQNAPPFSQGVTYRLSLREGRMHLQTVQGGSDRTQTVGGAVLPDKVTLEPLPNTKTSFIVKRVEYARGFAWAGVADRQYRGKLEISPHAGGLKIVNIVNLEEYLYSVVPSEMMISFPVEALDAQAILARSYALSTARYNRPHEADGYDLCDGQHCQVYSGASGEYAKTTNAVDRTRGIVLAYSGAVARPLFHSTCGGHTQSAVELKGWGDAPYLTGVVDGPAGVSFPSSPLGLERWIKTSPEVYCNRSGGGPSPEFRWFRIVPAVFVQEKIERLFDIGGLLGVSVVRHSSSGYANGLLVRGTKGSVLLEREGEVRRFLGIGPLRSGLYWLETKFGVDGRPDEFVVYGGGWGHGVGMCQTGAGEMARRGFTHTEILKHYYGKAQLKNLGY